MTTRLIDFLTDTVIGMEEFADDILNIHVRRDPPYDACLRCEVIATGNHPKRMLSYRVASVVQDELLAPIHMGSLSYLRKTLSSSLMRDGGRLELAYRMQNKTPASVESMRFIAPRLEADFQCTNPALMMVKDQGREFPRPDGAVFFPIAKSLHQEILGIAKVSAQYTALDLVGLIYDGKTIKARFPGTSRVTTITLAAAPDITGNMEMRVDSRVSLDRLILMLKLAGKNQHARGALHELAMCVDFHTDHAAHTILTPSINR